MRKDLEEEFNHAILRPSLFMGNILPIGLYYWLHQVKNLPQLPYLKMENASFPSPMLMI